MMLLTKIGSVPNPTKRVLFADLAAIKFKVVSAWLQRDGVQSDVSTDLVGFLDCILKDSYDVCVVNLLLGGMGPFELVSNIRKTSKNPDIKIIVVSGQLQKLNIQNSINAGAHDFVADPFENENIYHRIHYHLSPKKVITTEGYGQGSDLTEVVPEAVLLLLTSVELLCKITRDSEHETFLKILQTTAAYFGSNRTSLIMVEANNDAGVVLASSDDPDFYNFPIALHKYPEILHVIHTGNLILIDDVSMNSMTTEIREKVKTIQIGSLMVFPVRFQNEIVGVLTVRRPKASKTPSLSVLRILQAIANTMAAYSNTKVILRRLYKDYELKSA